MVPGLEVAELRLNLRSETDIRLPRYAGSTLRGAFGVAFKQLVCVNPTRVCEGCAVRAQCPYIYVFETPPTVDQGIFRQYPAVPHPFVMTPPGDGQSEPRYNPGDALAFGLTLIGRGLLYLPYFLYTFDQLGQQGIGAGRGRYVLTGASAADAGGQWHPVYDGQTKQLVADYPRIRSALDEPAGPVERVQLNFVTPARLIERDDLVTDLSFRALFGALLRRVSALCQFHGDGPLEVDFKGLTERAAAVQTVASDVTWYDWERYSNRQKRAMKLGGLIGSVAYEGALDEFMPYLRLGERVHVGKGTSFGLGKYEMRDG